MIGYGITGSMQGNADVNLAPSEEKIVCALAKQRGGKAWASRNELEGEFGCPPGARDSSERRTLDHTLVGLVDRGIVVS